MNRRPYRLAEFPAAREISREPDLVANLYHENYASLVPITGGVGKDNETTARPQAHYIRDALLDRAVPDKAILVEDESDSTLENVRLGSGVLEAARITPASILIVCKSHHAGRAWRTLTRRFRATTISCFTYDAQYSGVPVSAAGWCKHEISRKRVCGEFRRMQLYTGPGDISQAAPD